MPDGRLDSIPEDDRLCQTFSVILPAPGPADDPTNVRVFPNPAIDQMHFQVITADGSGRAFSLKLTSASGQVILREKFTGTVYTVPGGLLPAGVYFYEVSDQEKIIGKGKAVMMRE